MDREMRYSGDDIATDGSSERKGHAVQHDIVPLDDFWSSERAQTRISPQSRLSHISSLAAVPTGDLEGLHREPIPVSDLNAGIIGWESQDDPDMPLNFPAWKKWFLVGLISAMTFITPFASSILSPAITNLNRDFDIHTDIIGSLTVTIYLSGYVVGPLFLAPLSELYGRKPVVSLSNVFFCATQVGCALAPNIATLIVFRFFSGVGGAACLTLGGAVVGDLFLPDQRGTATGFWSLGPIFGPAIGPLIGAFTAETIGWRWDFWIVLALGATLTVLMQIFNQETNHRVLMRRKVNRLRKLGRRDLKSCYGNEHGQSQLLHSLVRPMKLLLLSPSVFALSLYHAFVQGLLYLLFTTVTTVFQETYGFSTRLTGLVYLALAFGNILGWGAITALSDRLVIKLAKAAGGEFQPEMRLAAGVFFGWVLPVTFFWYGWSTEYKLHWASSVFSLVPFGAGILGISVSITTYLVDCYPIYSASALAANTVLRSLVGALLPLAGPPMYRYFGLGWGNSLLGFLCIGMIPIPVIFYKFGARLRRVQNFRL